MPIITNKAEAGRGINVVDPVTLAPRTVLVRPGESIRGVLADPADVICRALQDSGEMDFGGQVAPMNKAEVV